MSKGDVTVQLTGVRTKVVAGAVTVMASLAWHASWVHCAIERYVAARKERSEMQGSGERWVQLSREFHASVLTIVSCAFALEALQRELGPLVVDQATRRAWAKKSNAKARVTPAEARAYETLRRACTVPQAVRGELKRLFTLRGGAAHAVSKMKPTEWHPGLSSNVAEPQATYILETATRALKLILDVYGGLLSSPRTGAVAWVAGQRSNLQAMVEQVRAALA